MINQKKENRRMQIAFISDIFLKNEVDKSEYL